MEKSMKAYQLEIFGDNYSLVSDESEEHVISAAQLVDKYMKEIADKVTIKNQQRIAVLAAVRIASILLYKEATLEEQRRYIDNMIEVISKELPNNDAIMLT